MQIIAESQVTHIEALNPGYRVHRKHPWKKQQQQKALTSKNVILSAGVIGTVEILFASRDRYQTLTNVSAQLGEHVRTNSEAVVSIISKNPHVDVTHGKTISSHFHADNETHITQNRFPQSYEFMKFYMGPLIAEKNPLKRAFKVLGYLLFQPFKASLSWRTKNWYKRVTVLTIMQQADNQLRFVYARSLLKGGRRGLKTELATGERAPSFIPLANHVAEIFAKVSQGVAQNNLAESLGNLSVTAHLLGGAVMADCPEKGVIDASHQVFGHPNLYIVDGSAIPVNVGVNPSLTITALAERFAKHYKENSNNNIKY